MNIAVQILEEISETIEDYDEVCGELADLVLHRHPKALILYVEPENIWEDLTCKDKVWSYHMTAVVDGIVHDAWFPELLLPPKQYVKQAFPNVKTKFTIHGCRKDIGKYVAKNLADYAITPELKRKGAHR